MKIFLKRFLIYLIQKLSLNEKLASLNKLVNYKVNKPHTDKVFAYFIDSFGSKHKLIEGLRGKIKPGWEGPACQLASFPTLFHKRMMLINGY